MALDSNYGTYAVYLCFYASLNNVIKTVMKMLCFWKYCKTNYDMVLCNTYFVEIKIAVVLRCSKICVFISVLCICDLYI